MRILVMGASGFVGRHVCAELKARGHEVEGWSRRRTGVCARERSIDLALAETTRGRHDRYDAGILLAGVAVPGPGFDARAAETNTLIAKHGLDFLERTSQGARVIVMSSAHVYGAQGDTEPLQETRPTSPNGLYGESKLAIEALARQHTRLLQIVIVRAFNQIGQGMPQGLFVPDLVAALAQGSGPVAMRGMDGVRDFLDVRDGARALCDLLRAPAPSGTVLNLCSGRGVRLSELARELARALWSAREVRFAGESPLPFVGSHAALTRLTGFEPRIPLAETLPWIAAEAAPSRA